MNDKKKVSVLLVDDEGHIRTLMKAALKEMNCDIVAEAQNGKEAIELYRRYKPDITIMDINMPVMDGKEALRTIKSEFPDSFVVMLTSVSTIDIVKEILEIGASNYIRKDTSLKEIKKGIKEAWVEYREKQRERKSGA